MLTITLVFKDGDELILQSDRSPWRWAEFVCVRTVVDDDEVVYYPVADITTMTVKGSQGMPAAYRGAA